MGLVFRNRAAKSIKLIISEPLLQYVSNVINFDFPLDVDSYVHRVGRTARGNNTGSALSLVSGKEAERAAQVQAYHH